MHELKVTPWPDGREPTLAEIQNQFAAEGINPYRWSNNPHDKYSAHVHRFHKVIYVVWGSITFGLPELNQSLTLQTGDRLDLPAGVVHDAVVGSQGVVCLEGHIMR